MILLLFFVVISSHVRFNHVTEHALLKRSCREMEKNGVIEGLRALPPPAHLTVAVAINGNRKSTKIVKWALENFLPEGKTFFKLLHVRHKITAVPTPSKLFPFHI